MFPFKAKQKDAWAVIPGSNAPNPRVGIILSLS